MIIPSHLFSRVVDIRGHKDNMCVVKKTPKKIGARFLESVLSCQHSLNNQKTQNNHLETQTNAQDNKRQNLPIK
jgi:hypothetical protein